MEVSSREKSIYSPAFTGKGFALAHAGGVVTFQDVKVEQSMQYNLVLRYQGAEEVRAS